MRAAVIGVGSIGKHHARVYTDLEDVELVAVADPDAGRREQVARRYKIPTYSDPVALFERERPDLVSVAVPTALHYPVALSAIERGVHTLVEKPITAHPADAEKLIELAARRGVTLAVGHVERFNSAVIELKRRLGAGEAGTIFQVQSRRWSPFPAYVHDVGVVMDLATHELDVLRYLLDSEPATIYARTMRRMHPDHEDALFAILDFPAGPTALLDINWLTPIKLRELRVTGQRGMFVVDYMSQDLYFHENSYRAQEWDSLALFRGMEEGNVLKIRLHKEEPLRLELLSFVSAVRNGTPPGVGGADGLRALLLAQALLSSSAERRIVRFGERAG
ncbi:MAG TPA: Gfo/Idh/MocA family oxidoreductase [Thermoanaerobaculia bacterium]|jgi:predicted dehydrogenase|nr:Gfo/Idh/MocA family oxidoreductase [Thermoanaerobaculia bacterium]